MELKISSNEELLKVIKTFSLKDIKTVLFGVNTYKILKQILSGSLTYEELPHAIRYSVKTSIEELLKKTNCPKPIGFNVYILEAGLSNKTSPMIEHGWKNPIKDNKDVWQCQTIIREEVYDCYGTPFRETNQQNVYIRKHIGWKYEIAVISEESPKLSQKKVKEFIEGYRQGIFV